MKKILFALAIAVAGVSAFAEGEGGSTGTGIATEQLQSIITSIQSWFEGAWPVIMGLAGVLLVPWLLKTAIRVIKSLASAFK